MEDISNSAESCSTELDYVECNCSDQEGDTIKESRLELSTCKPFEDNASGESSTSINSAETYDAETSSCSSCSTRRNSFCESDFEITFNSLFRTPSTNTTSHSSNLGSPIGRQPSNALDGIDILLQRISSERFAELRNIQLSERPVSNGSARENIETFFRRAVHGPTEEEQRNLEDANRPAEVINDVQLLQERSVVQSALQNQFRSILERALLTRVSSTQATAPQLQNVPQRQRNRVGGSDFRARLESLYGARTTTSPNSNVVRPTRNATSHQNIPTRPVQQNRSAVPSSGHVPAPPPIPVNDGESATSNFSITIDAGLQLLAENIADDLNRLESLQVVSSMLTGGFRGHLEAMVQQRINDESTGRRTQQFIRELPGRRPTPTQRHPSSSHTHSVSQASINAGVSAELDVLKGQMEEMKRMLAMSMEIQMDTQRAIRQEVSAIFSTFMQDYLMPRAAAAPVTQPSIAHPPIASPVASGQCVICIDRHVDSVLYQCGHMCVCNQCGLQLKMDGHNCPMCRAPIRDVIRAYQTQS